MPLPAGWEAEPICMQQEQEPSKTALQRLLHSQGPGGSAATPVPAEPSLTPPCPALTVQAGKSRLGSHPACEWQSWHWNPASPIDPGSPQHRSASGASSQVESWVKEGRNDRLIFVKCWRQTYYDSLVILVQPTSMCLFIVCHVWAGRETQRGEETCSRLYSW